MRRPHVYERSAPRQSFVLAAAGPPGRPRPTEAALSASRALPKMIDEACAAGADALADALEAARVEAERVLGEARWR